MHHKSLLSEMSLDPQEVELVELPFTAVLPPAPPTEIAVGAALHRSALQVSHEIDVYPG
jgi:hypothetical protein